MAFLDFLFQGSPPPSVTTYGSSTAGLPQWLSDYTQGLVTKANAVAGEAYQPYGGPRVADFTGDQQSAFGMTRDAAANPIWKTGFDQGQGAIGDAMGLDPSAAAAGNLNKAGQASYDTVGNYMNPYQDQVVSRMGDMAARQLQEKLIPAIGDDFTKAGQFGSSRQTQAVGNALRDTNESVLAQQGALMNQGYQQSMQNAQTDASRFGNIGQVQGNLTAAQQQNLGNLGYNSGVLGQLGQSSQYKDAAALEGIGNTQQNLTQTNLNTAYNDFLEQRQYPWQQINNMQGALTGVPYEKSTTTTSTAPGTTFAPSPLSSIASAGMSALSLANMLK
jgi:hypothetical protein